MAMEVSCGQCNGRLLVETLGVVVACPHCGVHLSIPAPEPAAPPSPPAFVPAPVPQPAQLIEPAPVQAPQPIQFTPAPPKFGAAPELQTQIPEVNPPPPVFEAPSGAVQPVTVEISPPEPEPSDAVPAPPPNPPASNIVNEAVSSQDDHHSASVLSGGEENAVGFALYGWASAPNLYLSPEASAPASVESTPESSPTPATVKPADPIIPPVTAGPPETPETVTTIPSFSEPTTPVAPKWTFAAAPTPPSAPEPAPALSVVPPATPEPLKFSAAEVPPLSGQTSAPSGLTFSAAPQNLVVFTPAPVTAPTFAPIPPPPTFQAAMVPATTAVPTTPLVFGSAPVQASQPTLPTQLPALSAANVEMASAPTSSVADEAANYADNELTSRLKLMTMLLIIVASYASAISIVLVYILVAGGKNSLESLPDLIPRTNKNGDISWDYNPPQNDVARWHVLNLGQTRRFGNVKVTPMKVTRGRLRFEHFSREPGNSRDPSNPILKLWVKFENVSSDQTFAPLDSHLLFTRETKNMGESVKANSFVGLESNRKRGRNLFYLFDMPIFSEFRIVGQKLGQELSPGTNLETFVPSDDDAVSLNGDLVWRFQIRKGYNRNSHRGVTTLIDVRFNSSQITEEG